MANVRLADATANAMLDAIKTKIDAGSGAGTIKIYGTAQPANANTATSGQTLLATLTFSDPCASAASSRTLTFSAITQDTAIDATAEAIWARIADSDGNTVFDCDVGVSGDSPTITFNTDAFVSGGPAQISSLTLSL